MQNDKNGLNFKTKNSFSRSDVTQITQVFCIKITQLEAYVQAEQFKQNYLFTAGQKEVEKIRKDMEAMIEKRDQQLQQQKQIVQDLMSKKNS